MNFFIKTFGCQYNEWDAARLSFVLKKAGLSETNAEEAEVVFIINCSVRQTAVDRTYGLARNFYEQGKKIVITGCILDHDRKMFTAKNITIWDINNPEELKGILGLSEEFQLTEALLDGQKISNSIPIMKGCNNFCSYCAVPYTRGREISRPMTEVLQDVHKVLDAGYKEIWLLGQNVNSYKNQELRSKNLVDSGSQASVRNDKLINKSDFAVLLEEISNIPGDFIVYFTSNHPKDMTDDIIEAIAKLPKIAKRIHLPLQSGSNKILKLMNRPYTKEQYLELVDKIKSKIPNVEITTDSIVGFPGETENDFQETVSVFQEIGFFQAFNNKYSPRSGTKAFNLGDPIPWEEKQRRWRILNELVNQHFRTQK